MYRINITQVVIYFLFYVVLQLPLLYKFVLGDHAFGFFYLGFLLFFPFGINPFLRLTIGFIIGLLMDMLSNTPGMHAAACTMIMFVKDYWLVFLIDEPEDDANLTVFHLGPRNLFLYTLPLIFLHFLIIFGLEHGKWEGFGLVLERILFSGVFSFTLIVLLNVLIAKRPERR
jgi:hypothetical protein